MKTLSIEKLTLGCDPELFISKNGKTVGSEKVVAENGFRSGEGLMGYRGMVVRDGVQVELNPEPSACRVILASNISSCVKTLHGELERMGGGFAIDFKPVTHVTKQELMSLSKKSRVFGCKPSFNAYTNDHASNTIKVDPMQYRKRSAGGHIHLGKYGYTSHAINNALKDIRTVQVLDILVGNTCVLLDRDKNNIERRKLYGCAGEHRTPDYGLEYRVLSNFWLRDFALMSMVTGLARVAVNIVGQSTKEDNYAEELLHLVDQQDIRTAINTNSYRLAYKNFKKIEGFISDVLPNSGDAPINSMNMQYFHHFVKRGLDYWFDKNPLQHWVENQFDIRNIEEGIELNYDGFNKFLTGIVAKDMKQRLLKNKSTKSNATKKI